jgi:hypothetical protein
LLVILQYWSRYAILVCNLKESQEEGKLTPDVVGLGFLFEVKNGGRGGLKQGGKEAKEPHGQEFRRDGIKSFL